MALRTVAALGFDGVGSFGLGILGEVFGVDHTGLGLPRFEFSLCAERPGPIRSDSGLLIHAEHGLDTLAAADLVVFTHWPGYAHPPSAALLDAIHTAYDNGAVIASHCTGAWLLANAGLLDGRRATTHWRVADEFRARFPQVDLVPEVLYIDEGRLVTGAGCAAGVDVSLYLLRREFGAALATAVAREMVVPPHRDGGQAQFISAPIPSAECGNDRLSDVMAWAKANLGRQLTVDDLANRALMSPRSFARHFKATVGATPHAWLLAQRLHHAEELLETRDLPVEEIARRSGFGTAAALREQFVRRRGVPPRDYRRSFASR
ncbi:GlxA family transcriptional regulator [Catenuloplanes atrovinosus]|uniref:Transcriptional regulator GlxA family with amidase domain n=1 Tax=Catenuloplanes atrovinosus TaxID=137266 RepID=A0AAE4CDD9_9ACTN|nr:helix-turn-helix domain-containing protein [Catenuloplanes atrovinosus]MDR7280526.1 transcriptional regulator GlxA family with amidase domain [Catenuloplanes atrovinosus]